MRDVVDLVALFTTLAIVAVLAKNPQIVNNFFNGVKGTIGAAVQG